MESSTHQQQPEMRVNAPPSDFDLHSTPDIHSTEEITQFQDEVPKQESIVTQSIDIPEGQDPFPDQSLLDFLSRPRIVRVVKWQTDAKYNSLLLRLPFPDALFESPTVWNKLQQYVYLHAGLKFAIRVNGTAYHYGQLLAVWRPACLGRTVPDPGDSTPTPPTPYDNVVAVSQYDHMLISPSAAQVVEMEVPYMVPLDRIPLAPFSKSPGPSNLARTFANMGVFEIWCLTPLRATGSSEDPPVTLTLYASFTNPSLSGYTHSQLKYVESAVPYPKDPQLPTLPIYFPTLSQSKRGLQPAGSSETDGGATGSRSADEAQLPIVFQPAKISSSQYAQPSYSLAINEESVTSLSPSDAVNLSSHLSDWSFFTRFEISNKKNLNDLLFAWYNTPYNSLYGTIAGSLNKPVLAYTKLAYIASLFNMWRGPIEYRLDFVASKFHSARVKIAWLPPETSSIPGLSETPDTWSKIIDIQGSISVTFTVPYLYSLPFIPFDSTLPSRLSNGIILITLLNPLTYPTPPAPSITCNIWVRAPDIQFAGFLGARSVLSTITNGAAAPSEDPPGMFDLPASRLRLHPAPPSNPLQKPDKLQKAQAKLGEVISAANLSSIVHKPSLLGYVTPGGSISISPPFPEPLPADTFTYAAFRMNTLLDYLAIIHVGFVGSLRFSALNPSSDIVFVPRLAKMYYCTKVMKDKTDARARLFSLRFNSAAYFPADGNALKDATLPCYSTLTYRPYSWYQLDSSKDTVGLSVPGIDIINFSTENSPITLSASSDFSFVGKAPAPMIMVTPDDI
nr:MAG: capsid protein [Picornaviridae sp.]